MNYIVIFENSFCELKEIGRAQSYKGANEIIHKFCEERNFRIYYSRFWIQDGKLVIDVGSHSNFFYVLREDGAPMTPEDLNYEASYD